jgi:hypothetical protein
MDVVPNHMCIASSDNHWWNDVLENGRSSPFAAFFDIDWHPPKTELHEKVLLPVLGEQYGRVLENQELSIRYEAGAFFVHYWATRYPLGPRTILPLLEPIVAELRRSHPPDHPDVLEIESIVTATTHLPTRWDTEPEQVRERMREKEIVKRRLDTLVSGSAAVRDALERSLAAINGDKGTRAASIAGGAAGRSGLSPQLLGRRRRGDQLPPLLRHQRPGRHPRRAAERAGRRARQGVPAAARRHGDRPAHRPRRRADGSVALPASLQRACAATRRRATARRDDARSHGRRCRPTSSSRRSCPATRRCRASGRARHDRLRVPERRERPVRRRRRARARSSACTSACARDAASSMTCSTSRSG